MKIDLNDIKQMVSECVKKILSEGISTTTYHFTSLQSCIDILRLNSFNLTLSSNKSDAYDNKRLFYLSTQRSRNKELGYAGHLGSCVRIQLDGKKIMEKYTGKPIDYWASMGKQSYYNPEYDSTYGKGFGRVKQTHHNFEMEDRIFSYEPTIQNASSYINRIDVYIDGLQNRINIEKDYAISIYVLSVRNDIPVYIYNNLKDFNMMTNNVINNEIKDLYKNDFHARKEMEYKDYDRYKISKDFQVQNKNVEILKHVLNVLSNGKIFDGSNDSYALINKTLKQFGLEKYVAPVINDIKKSWGSSFEESCGLLSNTINTPIRKLNTDHPSEESNRIMKLGVYVLRKHKVSNFDDLRRKQ